MSTHTPEKLIQHFLKNWDITPANYYLNAVSENSSYAQCLSRPSDETIKEIVEAGPTFGFAITVTEPAEAKTGLKLTFLWDNLEETEEAMASVGLIEKEPAGAN